MENDILTSIMNWGMVILLLLICFWAIVGSIAAICSLVKDIEIHFCYVTRKTKKKVRK